MRFYCNLFAGLGNLAARWPRHIVEAIKAQEETDNSDDGFTTLASTPVSSSMSSTPSEPIKKVDTSEVDLQAEPSQGEKGSAKAESPITAMDLAMNKGQTAKVVRGIKVPIKPPPPGPEGESND